MPCDVGCAVPPVFYINLLVEPQEPDIKLSPLLLHSEVHVFTDFLRQNGGLTPKADNIGKAGGNTLELPSKAAACHGMTRGEDLVCPKPFPLKLT